jgi:hypothetical protein
MHEYHPFEHGHMKQFFVLNVQAHASSLCYQAETM